MYYRFWKTTSGNSVWREAETVQIQDSGFQRGSVRDPHGTRRNIFGSGRPGHPIVRWAAEISMHDRERSGNSNLWGHRHRFQGLNVPSNVGKRFPRRLQDGYLGLQLWGGANKTVETFSRYGSRGTNATPSAELPRAWFHLGIGSFRLEQKLRHSLVVAVLFAFERLEK